MAVPRVFISSTYYDLKQVRYNIGDFIKNLGYEAVMHERSGVAYTQNEPLEEDCYHELASCDIVVCIIGNHFGSKSSNNELSITMNEIQTAIKNKKKVYIFIANDVYIENRTYEQNKESGNFKSAYTDDIKIHEFISDLKSNVKIHVIESFDTIDQIVNTLKLQFAGLFQNLLAREASLTEGKTAYDLQQSSDRMKEVVEEFRKEKEDFFQKFDGSIFAPNVIMQTIQKYLEIKNIKFFVSDLTGLDELLTGFGFSITKVDDPIYDSRKYTRVIDEFTNQTLTLKDELVTVEGKLKDIRSKKVLDENLIWSVEDNGELPF